jgi:O-antigen/teichoic acid export membrane protein
MSRLNQSAGSSRRTVRVFGGLLTSGGVSIVVGLVTAPILARALGPDGRGLFAAVAVPIGLAPFVAQLGLGAYAARAAARRVHLGTIIGSVGVLLAILAGIVALATPGIADLLGDGRPVVERYLAVGLWLLALPLLGNLLLDILWGIERWRELVVFRTLNHVLYLAGIVALAVLGELTLEPAILVAILVGPLATLPLLAVVRARPRVDAQVARSALSFGVRAWPGTLAGLANTRLDQVIMVPLAGERQLGLYAVSVTVATLPGMLAGPIGQMIFPRLAATDGRSIARYVRTTMALVAITSMLGAALCPLLIPMVFGSAFSGAVRPAWVLLVGAVPLAGIVLLNHGLLAIGRPGLTSIGELVAAGVTVAMLVVLLPPLGAMGAAITSVVAYALSFLVLAERASRALAVRVTAFVVPRRDDAVWLWAKLGSALRGTSAESTLSA